MRTLFLVLLLIVILLTAVLTIVSKSVGDTDMMKFMGITSSLSLLVFGILAMVNGQLKKPQPRKSLISGIQKLPRR